MKKREAIFCDNKRSFFNWFSMFFVEKLRGQLIEINTRIIEGGVSSKF